MEKNTSIAILSIICIILIFISCNTNSKRNEQNEKVQKEIEAVVEANTEDLTNEQITELQQICYNNNFLDLYFSEEFVEGNIYKILDVRENYIIFSNVTGVNGITNTSKILYLTLNFVLEDEMGERLNYRVTVADDATKMNKNFEKLSKIISGDKVIYTNGLLELYKE